MPRAKTNVATRALKAALSTRIPSHLDDRLHAYTSSARYTIEEAVTAALEAYLDAQAPETKARFQAPAGEAPTPALSTRMDGLESKVDRLLAALAEPTAGRRRAGQR